MRGRSLDFHRVVAANDRPRHFGSSPSAQRGDDLQPIYRIFSETTFSTVSGISTVRPRPSVNSPATKMLVGPSAPPMTPTLASSASPSGKSSSVSAVSRHTSCEGWIDFSRLPPPLRANVSGHGARAGLRFGSASSPAPPSHPLDSGVGRADPVSEQQIQGCDGIFHRLPFTCASVGPSEVRRHLGKKRNRASCSFVQEVSKLYKQEG